MTTLTPAQKVAFDDLMPFCKGETSPSFAVLEGYAGTGKTFLVSLLLTHLKDYRVAVAAPTNKAVRVLKDKLVEAGVAVSFDGQDNKAKSIFMRLPGGCFIHRFPCCTCRSIHSLLGLRLKELDDGQQEAQALGKSTLRDYDLVVVDECSMVDDFLFEKIISERGDTRILFVGDPAQLPPVQNKTRKGGYEALAFSPVFSRVNHKVRLTDVVRQAQDNPIIQLSLRLRQFIEAGVKADPITLLEALPATSAGAKATLETGNPNTLIQYWLAEREFSKDSDTRIIAYTNDRVQFYNRAIHQALHGATPTVFSPGERIIVHEQCDARKVVDRQQSIYESVRLMTSDELLVKAIREANHPFYPTIPANELELADSLGNEYVVYVAADESLLNQQINACFSEWRSCKSAEKTETNVKRRDEIHEQAVSASGKGWSLKKAFASLRHAYAITCHKSQGSTFDCALVDFSDLSKMQNPLEFNRALYVAVTRSREFLALVIT